MNTTQAKQIPLKSYLKKLNIQPVKEHNSQAWYLSPFRAEKTASFKIDSMKNLWYDHGVGFGGNILDFMMKYHNCTLSEALKILDNNSFSFHQQEIFEKQPIDISSEENNKPHIVKISPCIKHPALREYMKYRGLKNYDNCNLLFEIHYEVQERAYFGLGFKNDSGGYEIRNKYSKTSILKKDITHIKNGSKILRVFEGFMDYLTFLELAKYPVSDYLILNSLSMLSRINYESLCEVYILIETYLDNDNAGDLGTETIFKKHTLVIDKRKLIYPEFKDLNEFHMNCKNPNKTI